MSNLENYAIVSELVINEIQCVIKLHFIYSPTTMIYHSHAIILSVQIKTASACLAIQLHKCKEKFVILRLIGIVAILK